MMSFQSAAVGLVLLSLAAAPANCLPATPIHRVGVMQASANSSETWPDMGDLMKQAGDVAGSVQDLTKGAVTEVTSSVEYTVNTGDAKWPDVGAWVKQAKGVADNVQNLAASAVTDAAEAANATLEEAGDQIRQFTEQINEQAQDLINEVNKSAHQKAERFRDLAVEGLDAAVKSLSQVTATLQSAERQAVKALEIVGQKKSAEDFIQLAETGLNKTLFLQFALEQASESLRNASLDTALKGLSLLQDPDADEKLAARIGEMCAGPLNTLFDAADTVKSVASDYSQAFRKFADSSILKLEETLPKDFVAKVGPALQGVAAQASLQLQPLTEAATQLSSGLRTAAKEAGIRMSAAMARQAPGLVLALVAGLVFLTSF
ncbi:unnamed protein product [Polarella glacialis]|uniref:Uncharacterized protein n=1 Tax=Polarella glacialis TaxID=89957 RepID=A0A813FKE1_POLGL|nr:unnamed protein product [Polarella glacialis]CAE8680560.1 unnamed protein product [Polarella glacialis]|mmetsp:Transcript_69633/g.112240  ORF Transcript_69633/g.112240 Transcript_69633/m.112240 type:complete len:376 (+) Transcript_69633:88-1215(+)